MTKKAITKKNVVTPATTIESILENIEISTTKRRELAIETVGEVILSKIPIIGELTGAMDSYRSKLDSCRMLALLQEFKNRHDNIEKFQDVLKKLLSDHSGMYLFQKVVAIVNAGDINPEYIKLLANVLRNISDSDFKLLFEEHVYTLSQIEKLTPQGLLILAEASNWPFPSYASSTSSGITTGEGWDKDFAQRYGQARGIQDHKILIRVSHALNDLKNHNILELRPNALKLTPIGEEVAKYLKS